MKNNIHFTRSEIDALCDLYQDGRLSRNEEKALERILEDSDGLSSIGRETLRLIRAENLLFSHKNRRNRIWRYCVAASVAVIVGCLAYQLLSSPGTDDKETFIVWQNGEKITGERARKIAEECQEIDMEMIRQVMKQQREMMKINYASVEVENYEY